MQWLAEIKKKPRQTRQMYAFSGALLSTLVLTGIWATTLPAQLSILDLTPYNEISTTTPEREVPVAVVPPKQKGLLERWQVTIGGSTRQLVAAVGTLLHGETTVEPVEPVVATTTPQVWTEAVATHATNATGTPILIATTSSLQQSTTTATTSSSRVINE